MEVGFVLGFVAAFVSSAAIVAFWSLWATSLAKFSEAPHRKQPEVEMDRMLFDELRCI